MNRTKSMLLAATALATFTAPQAAGAQTAIPLPPPPAQPVECGGATGTSTFSGGISADGTVVIGRSDSTPRCIVRWTNGVSEIVQGGGSGVPTGSELGGFGGVSGNGRAFTFTLSTPGPTTRDQLRARYWTPETLFQAFTDPSANQVIYEANNISTDGRYFAVNGSDVAADLLNGAGLFVLGSNRSAFRWSAAGGYENLGTLGVGDSVRANGISGDGNVIVGQDFIPNTIGTFTRRSVGFRWQSGAGIAQLPDLSAAPRGGTLAPSTSAIGISRDGSTIFGQSRGSDGFNQAVIWRSGVVTGLGFLPGYAPSGINFGSANATIPTAASADGSIIVGLIPTADFDYSMSRAWRWTAASGMQDLNTLAANAGIALNGFVLGGASGISDDGRFIAGYSYNTTTNQSLGYVLSIAAAPPPPTTLSTTARLIVTLTLPGVTQTSIVNQSFSTQVDGLLNGRSVFTRTVADQITGSLGVTALADARTALQVGGGLRRLVIGAPVLISNTTTVLNSISNTVNVASGTQVTTAAVVTNGPATVATGDLGICATAATNGVNPTGCSLPGTPVTVNTNVINTNTFTNTINSVTPTTTTTVNQLVSSKWQVSATAGNQFGTVHALVGPVAFERGDRLIGQLIDLGGTGGAAPVARAAVGGSGLTMFGGYFGNWARIDADSRVPVASVRGNTDGFVLGLEKALGDAHIGVAVDHGTSSYDVRDATYPETLSMKHTQLGLFANWQLGGFALDGAAAYGFGTVRTTLITPTTPATASRDVRSWSLGAQAGYGFDINATTIRLVAGVRHVSAKLNAFTETGGPTPLTGLTKTVTRTRLYGGVEVATRLNLGGITLTPRVHARAASDSGDASGTADLVFASAPNGPVMQAVGPGVGRTVAELGGSLDAAVGGNVHLWAGYDGTFRSGARSHSAKAGLTVNW